MTDLAMTEVKRRLFDAFREDHARLGRALHALGERLRAEDVAGAREVAETLDREAGAHIAFEEFDFYPALLPFLSRDEIDAMHLEHSEALALLGDMKQLGDGALGERSLRDALLDRVQAMERHVSDCGELFGVMGGLDAAAQRHLLERLDEWRGRAPRWSELATIPN